MAKVLPTSHICHVCSKEILPKYEGTIVCDGFLDKDTGQKAHMKCKAAHYKMKESNGMKGLFSEIPITIQI